jgi:hypothetical protein
MKQYLALACAAFVLHIVWEYAHIPLYTGYGAMEGALPVWLFATLGDVVYTLGAVLLVSLWKGHALWFVRATVRDYAGLALLGFIVALLVEYKALALHRWAYAAAMPIIPYLHVGLSPIVQMIVLLPVSVWLSGRFLQSQ